MVDSCKLREIELFTLKDSVAEALVSVRVKRLVLTRSEMALDLFETMIIHLNDHLLVKPRRQLALTNAREIAQQRGYDYVLFEPQAPGRHCRFIAFKAVKVSRVIGSKTYDLSYCQVVLMRIFGQWIKWGLAHARGMAMIPGVSVVPFPRPMREFLHHATEGWTNQLMMNALTFIRMMVFNMRLPDPFYSAISSGFGQHVDEARALAAGVGMLDNFARSEESTIYASKEPCFYMHETVFGESGVSDDFVIPISLAELVDM
jgi:hypothetical protein